MLTTIGPVVYEIRHVIKVNTDTIQTNRAFLSDGLDYLAYVQEVKIYSQYMLNCLCLYFLNLTIPRSYPVSEAADQSMYLC